MEMPAPSGPAVATLPADPLYPPPTMLARPEAPAAPPSSSLADREFTLEIRKGLLIIMRACMRRFKLSWHDFLPRGMAVIESGE